MSSIIDSHLFDVAISFRNIALRIAQQIQSKLPEKRGSYPYEKRLNLSYRSGGGRRCIRFVSARPDYNITTR